MERMLRRELGFRGFSDIVVESAGLLASAAGQPMAEFSIRELASRGISANGHASRYVGTLDLSSFDIIVTVGDKEATSIREYAGCPKIVVVLNDENGGIPNPWQQGAVAYSLCADIIESQIRKFARTF